MPLFQEYIIEKYPKIIFSQLTAGQKQRIEKTIEFSMWKTTQAAKELSEAVKDWADNCKI